ncbi:MAG TPA: oligosaccharide flippase family protein [Gaiellaceae bacterium]|nr:oligosaccharide flippase family protein [Gaiellaceae bacterium]
MSGLSSQLARLGRHSAIYGLGGLVSRVLAVLLLPLYTRYLTPSDYGKVETLVAATTVLTIVLRLGISSAFFRFYFDSPEPARRVTVLRTSFWFTMTTATAGLVAGLALAPQISLLLFGDSGEGNLVRAAFVGLWAQMNYEQLTSLFRVEERSLAFVLASLANVLVTVGATVVLVVALDQGPIGVVVGNFLGTLAVYLALLGYRREQLGLELDRGLLREMNRFGMPLVPSALFLWATNFADRFILVKLADTAEVGLYSVGVRIASAMVLLLTAFRTAWPAFAYSIERDEEAKRAYGFVLTYLVALSSWVAAALALLSPWLVDALADPAFARASRVVGPLAFSTVAFAGYVVISIGVGRARRTQFNWVVTGIAAAVNVGLCLALIPAHGMMGAAAATAASYAVMFVGMAWWAQRVYPVPYQWRRVALAAGAAIALVAAGKLAETGLLVSALLALAYPLALAPLGFLLPAERRLLRRALSRRPGRGRGSGAFRGTAPERPVDGSAPSQAPDPRPDSS